MLKIAYKGRQIYYIVVPNEVDTIRLYVQNRYDKIIDFSWDSPMGMLFTLPKILANFGC